MPEASSNLARRKGSAERRIEGTRADRRIDEVNWRAFRQKRICVAEDIVSELGRRRKLAELVTVGLRLLAIQSCLKREASGFQRIGAVHSQIPNLARSSIRCSHTQSIPSAAS